jgi:hypothetical protein
MVPMVSNPPNITDQTTKSKVFISLYCDALQGNLLNEYQEALRWCLCRNRDATLGFRQQGPRLHKECACVNFAPEEKNKGPQLWKII